LQQSLTLFNDLGHRHYVTQAHSFLGSIDLHLGQYEEARDQAQTGLTLAHEHGPRFCVGVNLLLLGCLELAQRAPATAYQLLEESVAVYREVGHREDLGLALACLTVAARGLGDTLGARQHLRLALEIAQESEAVPPLWWALPAMALLLADEGENEHAVELYALASRCSLVAKSRWFADMIGTQIAAAAAALSAERVSVLEERGRTRDLHATAEELLSDLRA
jgi:tetratricopeptide (TPR) repeat protein